MAEDLNSMQVEVNTNNLYVEEVVTDRKVANIRVLKPITVTGEPDTTRSAIYSGEVQIMTQMGPLPVSFEIPAKTLEEACKGYADAAKAGVQQTIEKLQQLRREAASQIVTPGTPGFQVPPAPGAGKIQMP